ncbi:MAG TPA: DUF523 and DUF1722 domain-containing protein [Candidatus Acidoferrum sp.]|nr:DUF523 and DUF1722 domain-containing protein [Candidatus Acidoferrum sp.]
MTTIETQAGNDRIKVGVSACLLGQQVRYNGGHKHMELLTRELANHFEFVPTCPELGAGMGVPRAPIRLVGDAAAPRAVQVEAPSIDFTEPLQRYARHRVPELHDLCGYVFIRNSPSCGLFRVKVYRDDGMPQPQGRGLFAAALTQAYPLLPVEEDGRLNDPVLRENFITRVFAMHEWRQLCARGLTAAGLIDLHSRYKYTLMAHAPQDYAQLGRLLADAGRHDPEELGPRYFERMMQLLQRKATRKTNTNVLMHLQGYLKQRLQAQEKRGLGAVIEHYRQGIVPLIVPVTLLKHYFQVHPDPYISRQAFFQPYPDELGLRNAV